MLKEGDLVVVWGTPGTPVAARVAGVTGDSLTLSNGDPYVRGDRSAAVVRTLVENGVDLSTIWYGTSTGDFVVITPCPEPDRPSATELAVNIEWSPVSYSGSTAGVELFAAASGQWFARWEKAGWTRTIGGQVDGAIVSERVERAKLKAVAAARIVRDLKELRGDVEERKANLLYPELDDGEGLVNMATGPWGCTLCGNPEMRCMHSVREIRTVLRALVRR